VKEKYREKKEENKEEVCCSLIDGLVTGFYGERPLVHLVSMNRGDELLVHLFLVQFLHVGMQY